VDYIRALIIITPVLYSRGSRFDSRTGNWL